MRIGRSSFILGAALTLAGLSARASETEIRLSQKYEPAVVKISTLEQGIEIGYGAGFFIDDEGTMLTNLHVVSALLRGPLNILVRTKSGEKFTDNDVQVGSCGGTGPTIDLCVLKIPFHPKSHFTIKPQTYLKGTDILAMGHPRGFDYTLSTGIISGIDNVAFETSVADSPEKKEYTIEHVQITAPLSPGNSGGPVFDKKGALIGVSTWVRNDVGSQNLNFAISANEIDKFLKSPLPMTPLTAFKKSLRQKRLDIAEHLKSTYLDPIRHMFETGEAYSGPKMQATPYDIKVEDKEVKFTVPDVLGNTKKCHEVNKGPLMGVSCYYPSSTVDLTVLYVKSKAGYLHTVAGKPTAQSKPLPMVKDLQATGQWEKLAKTLTPNQIKFLSSVPQPWKCAQHGRSPRYFLNNAYSCAGLIYNDGGAGVSTFMQSRQVEGDDMVLMTGITIADPAMAKFFFEVTDLIIESAEPVAVSPLNSALASDIAAPAGDKTSAPSSGRAPASQQQSKAKPTKEPDDFGSLEDN